MPTGKANIVVDLSLGERAAEFVAMLEAMRQRDEEQERLIQELWRRIHSLSEMIEDRGVH